MKFENFEYEVKFGLVKILSYTGSEERVEIPSKIGHYNVYTICTHAFLGLQNLKEVVIPKSVGCVEDSAFVDCDNLERIELGIIEKFGEPFEDCSSNIKFYTESPRMACAIERLGKNYDIYCEKDFKIEVTDETKKECTLVKVRPRSNKLTIPDEINGYKITKLGFTLGKNSFKRIKLPKYLKEIPDYFFSYQSHLSELIMGDSIEKIGREAFYHVAANCDKKTLKLSNKLKEIGTSAFSSCNFNIEFEPGTKLSKIESYGFQNAEVNFEGVEEFPLDAEGIFCSSSIKNLSLKNDHKTIPNRTFANANISNISGLANVSKIGARAFSGTSFDEEVIFDLSNVKEIENYAFDGSCFKGFYIPKDLELKEGMFRNAKATSITFDEDYVFTTIPSECFYYMNNLQKVSLPKSIISIATNAFYNAVDLKHINLENIEVFGSNVFYKTAIETLELGKNLKTLYRSAFAGMKHLQKVTFDDDCSLVTIPEDCFYSCSYLKDVTLPKNVRKIEGEAFRSTGLTSINLENIEELGVSSLSATDLDEINVPNVKTIPTRCFSYCKNLKKVILGSNLKSICDEAFRSCSDLKEVNLPKNLEGIGSYAFKETAIEEVIFPDKITKIASGIFDGCSNLKKVSLGKGIKRIDFCAFYNLGNLEELNLGNVEIICRNAITSCHKLKKLVIPESTTELYDEAIYNCAQLEDVRIEGTLKVLNLGVFKYCDNLTKVYTDDTASGKKLLSRKQNSITEIVPITPKTKKTRKRKEA